MINYLQERRLIRSRIEGVKEDGLSPGIGRKFHLRLGTRAHTLGLWLGLILGTALGYVVAGLAVQQLDPTAGWLDVGTLSLPLFAAWSCILGFGIAGLLPAVACKIGREGGIVKWNRSMNKVWTIVLYLGYTAVLCVLL